MWSILRKFLLHLHIKNTRGSISTALLTIHSLKSHAAHLPILNSLLSSGSSSDHHCIFAVWLWFHCLSVSHTKCHCGVLSMTGCV